MTGLVIALLSATGFAGAGLLALAGRDISTERRLDVTAIAAAILLALAFGDFFPTSLELAGQPAIAGFIGGFAFLFLVEAFSHGHTHHAPDEQVETHALLPFILGLAIHNAADGFAVAMSARFAAVSGGLVGLGVLIHQLPVGLSLAAVLAAAHATRRMVLQLTVLLALIIPFAAGVTAALPPFDDRTAGLLTSIAGGVLAYMSTGHLLPEAQSEHPSRRTSLVFIAALVVMTAAIFTVLGD